uniref:Uncharacterized protein n=1 Tax=Molossus molossus TaxID=27622 RepID=A0A7J8I8T6_MOLMO|nr:hypothetical protein HJG59_010571 [Molossus molossus]
MDPTYPAGTTLLHSHSASDIRSKLKKLEDGHETPQRELLHIAFKVFNNQEEMEREEQQKRQQENYLMLAKALQGNTGAKALGDNLLSQVLLIPASNANKWATERDSAQTLAPHRGLAHTVTTRATGELIALSAKGHSGRPFPTTPHPGQ